MARSTTVEHRLGIHKSGEKGSAYLLIYSVERPLERNDDGLLTVDLDELFGGGEVSAWSTLSNAKRYAAAKIGRQRLKWDEATTDTGDVNWTATVIEKITG